mgnify:CR=1 FL=1
MIFYFNECFIWISSIKNNSLRYSRREQLPLSLRKEFQGRFYFFFDNSNSNGPHIPLYFNTISEIFLLLLVRREAIKECHCLGLQLWPEQSLQIPYSEIYSSFRPNVSINVWFSFRKVKVAWLNIIGRLLSNPAVSCFGFSKDSSYNSKTCWGLVYLFLTAQSAIVTMQICYQFTDNWESYFQI